MRSKGEKYYWVASLAKGLHALDLLASEGDLSVPRAADPIGASRAAGHRFLATLRDLGLIEKIRLLGYAIDDEELCLGLRCAAAPVFDDTGQPNLALSVSGLTHRITEANVDAIQTKLVPLCRTISRQIGAPEKKIEKERENTG